MMTISRNNGIQFSFFSSCVSYTNMQRQIQQNIFIIRLISVFWHSIKQDISVFIYFAVNVYNPNFTLV